MREQTFVDRRQPEWERLEHLLQRSDRGGLRGLDPEALVSLARLYRATTTDLAVARARGYNAALQHYLNRLVARGHARVYAGSASGGWSRIGAFLGATFPREVRRSWRTIGICMLLFIVATVVAAISVRVHPLSVYALLPAEQIPLVQKALHDSNFAVDREFAPAMSSLIITNNIKVAALAFAGGMSLGVLTLWVILNNGLMLGGLGSLFAARGFGTDFWATVSPHGVIELTAIQISGGAGLLLAAAIIAPGRLRRIDAIKANARRAATLLIGVAALLVVAGTIEGFVSPLRTSIAFRFAFGALTAALLFAYLAFAGRTRPNANGEPTAARPA